MEVSLHPVDMIHLHTTEKKWVIPENLVEECDGDKFLQISASAYGLCNLLTKGSVGRLPSLKGSVGLISLLLKRKETMDKLLQGDAESEENEVLTRKKRKISPSTLASTMDLDLGDYGVLTIKTPATTREDLKIKYTTSNVDMFCRYMIGEGAECVDPERRTYIAKGAKSDP